MADGDGNGHQVDSQQGEILPPLATVRRAVREAITKGGIPGPELWSAWLNTASALVSIIVAGEQLTESPSSRIARVALAQGAVLGISPQEVARALADDCKHDVVERKPRRFSPWTRADEAAEREAAREDMHDAQRKGEM